MIATSNGKPCTYHGTCYSGDAHRYGKTINDIAGGYKEHQCSKVGRKIHHFSACCGLQEIEVKEMNKEMKTGFKEVSVNISSLGTTVAALGQKVDDLKDTVESRHAAGAKPLDRYGLAIGGTDEKAH